MPDAPLTTNELVALRREADALEVIDAFPETVAAMRAAAARLEELERIVARLPKTADGVIVTPGMEIWGRRSDLYGPAKCGLLAENDEYPIHALGWGVNIVGSECYSTKEAAEAARAWEGE